MYEKYGTVSGAMLDFANDIVAAFPDQLFQVIAYIFTETPPRTIRARENVIVQPGFLGHELMNGSCDTLRPLSHPNNAGTRKLYLDWHKARARLNVWLYHRKYRRDFAVPAACFWNFAEDFRFFKRIGVRNIYAESEYADLGGALFPNSFYTLHIYLASKLMDDPDRDADALIRDFMEKYYGAAAGEMLAYAEYLRREMAREKRPLGAVPERELSYLTEDF